MAKKVAETVKLVVMEKEGVRLNVHPTTVADHQWVGWKIVPEAEVKEDLPAPETNDESE